MQVKIVDWGEEQYLDGACMQYVIKIGNLTVAYCNDSDHARKIAHALSDSSDEIIWELS